jgi:two-component system, chemotaxis family, protein-glutamate methylesterase/glutaminase
VQSVKASGGTVIAQDRATSAVFQMPASVIQTGDVDYVLPLEEIGPALIRLVGAGPASQLQSVPAAARLRRPRPAC